MEPEPDLHTGSGSDQKVPALTGSATLLEPVQIIKKLPLGELLITELTVVRLHARMEQPVLGKIVLKLEHFATGQTLKLAHFFMRYTMPPQTYPLAETLATKVADERLLVRVDKLVIFQLMQCVEFPIAGVTLVHF